MNCSFCQSETPEFTEENGGKNAFCNLTCQTKFYDQIGLVLYNPITKEEMPDDLILKQLIKLSFKDLIIEYKAYPEELKPILDSWEFEKGWLKSFSTFPADEMDNMIIFFELINWPLDKRVRIGFILTSQIREYQLSAELLEYAFKFDIFNPRGAKKIFFWTIKINNVKIMKHLLLKYEGIYNFVFYDGIIMSVKQGHLEMFTFLITYIDMNIHKNDLFERAVRSGQPNIVRYLLETQEDLPLNNALIDAIEGNHLNVVIELLAHGTDPTVDDNYPLQIAAEQGHTEIVRLLLNTPGVNPIVDNNIVLESSASEGHAEVVELLLKDGRIDPSISDNTAIRIAAQEGHVEVVKKLLADGRVDPTADNNHAIRVAAQQGHAKVVKILLNDSRVDPSSDGNIAIRKAVGNDHLEIVKLLLERVYTEELYRQLIEIAKENNHKEILDYLQGFNRRMNEGDRKKTKILNKI